MATEKNLFILDDGTKEITFQNPFGEVICKIHIRGGDLSILDRYKKLTDDYETLIEPLANIQIKADGTSEFEQEWNVIKGVEQGFIDRINEVFDTKDCGNFFKNRHAFSTIGGVFYVEKVIEALGNLVSEEIKRENQMAQKRIGKYTSDIHPTADKQKDDEE